MKKRSALVFGLVGLLTVALMLPLMAASVSPDHIRGAAAKSCQQLAGDYAPAGTVWHELKVTPPSTSGSDGTLSVALQDLASRSFSWTADPEGPAVDAVYVKSGSQGSNIYVYPGQSYGDTDLKPPGQQSISHILFCYTGIPANQVPVAADDSYSTSQDTPLTVAAAGVLGNDSDGDGDSLTATLVAGPTNGSLGTGLGTDGSFTYTPAGGFSGSDSFTYVANDGTADSNTATVSIEVTPALFCDDVVVFSGEGEPTYQILAENGGAECVKTITYSAGTGEEGEQFVSLETQGDGQVVFLERIDFLPQVPSGTSQIGFELFYDDSIPFGDEVSSAKQCLVDPREYDGDDPLFDLADPYDEATGAGQVLPTGETTCIISALFVTTGSVEGSPLIAATYHLYNLNDGFRTFK